MESNASVVRRNWNYCNGNYFNANNEYWRYAIICYFKYPYTEKILPKSKEISIRLIAIYSSLTLVCAFFYKIFGMSFFDSIVHSMTTIATGGFSNYNESIGYFDSGFIELTAIIFIILGSVPFIAYIKYLGGDKKIFTVSYTHLTLPTTNSV